MKKTITLTIVICLSLLTAKAQLANTKWKGMMKISTEKGLTPVFVNLVFTADTLSVSYDNGFPPDVMVYKDVKGTVSFKKVSGGVPCDTATVMINEYRIKNDQLWIKAIQDDCKVRAQADVSQPFDRVK